MAAASSDVRSRQERSATTCRPGCGLRRTRLPVRGLPSRLAVSEAASARDKAQTSASERQTLRARLMALSKELEVRCAACRCGSRLP
jgi:hypothetical protein